ncbi:MAG: sugar ABC transporter permease [Lachnospiraceae bacterium]|nr:sugar ABC transporter permease [Lachnospiraceae bacterium]
MKKNKPKSNNGWKHDFAINKSLYLLTVPIVVYFIIFCYVPMFGVVMAFQDYKPARGILGSRFVGLKNFAAFFGGPNFFTLLRNTFVINALGLFVGFPLTIIFALLLNEIRLKWFKKSVQTISYMPYFVSMVVIAGLIIEFCSTNGVVTNLAVKLLGIQRENLLQNPKYFWTINLLSDIWQGLGYGSIFFISAITAVPTEQYEAAAIDGAGRWKRCLHVTLPGIMPAIVTMLILRCGTMMSLGGDKILLLYNSSIYETADVISTNVQRMGIENMQYGYATAVGLFNSVVGTTLLVISNTLSKKATDIGIV